MSGTDFAAFAFGLLLLFLFFIDGLSGFLWKDFYYKVRNLRGSESEHEHYSYRYIWHPGPFVVSLGIIIWGIMYLCLPLIPSHKEFYGSFFFFIPGVAFLTLATLVRFSGVFNRYFWKVVWPGPDKNRDRENMSLLFFMIALAMFYFGYLFSGLFLL